MWCYTGAAFLTGFLSCMKKLSDILLLLIMGLSCVCWGDNESSGGFSGFKLVTTQNKYAQREWQVPPQFFSSGLSKEKMSVFFRENQIRLSKDGQLSYVRGACKLMMADTAQNLDKVDKLIRKYVKSVETRNLLVPAVSCAEIVDGKKKVIPYPDTYCSSYLADIRCDSGVVSPNMRNFYILMLHKKERKADMQRAREILLLLEERKDIVCVVVTEDYKAERIIPSRCKVPVIPMNRLKIETNQFVKKYSTRVGTGKDAYYEIEEEYLDENTRLGRLLNFLNDAVLCSSGSDTDFGSDFGSNFGEGEGLYTGYGKKVSGITDREEMVEFLKGERQEPVVNAEDYDEE